MIKKLFTALFLTIIAVVGASAQTMSQQEIADRLALKNLVDTFSVLADEKNIDEQVLLFTEDGICESYAGGKQTSYLVGRQQMNDAFSAFLALFDTVYHQNGQQTLNINGDTATGTAYCQVVLIGMKDGKRVMNTQGVIYNDEYLRQNGRWLIKHRKSNFVWMDSKIME